MGRTLRLLSLEPVKGERSWIRGVQTNSFLAQSGAQEDVFLPIKIKFAFRRREGEP